MLEDRFGRQFHYLRLSVTEACNFRCQYCLPDGYQGPPQSSFLTLPEISTAVKAFASLGTSKVRITGGEPSLRRDLPDIIQACKSTTGISTVAMTSHGERLARHANEWRDAGLDQINISIDSLDPRQFHSITGKDSLKKVLDGIDRAIDAGIKVKVNAVLMQGFTDNRLQRFLNWLKTMPVTLRFIELMETGDHHDFYMQKQLRGESLKAQLAEAGWQPIIRQVNSGPAQEFIHPEYAGRIGLIMPYSKDFCSTCNRLRLSAVGKLHLCLFSEYGIDMRDHLTTGDVIGLRKALQEVLLSKHSTHFLHDGNTGATRNLAMLGG